MRDFVIAPVDTELDPSPPRFVRLANMSLVQRQSLSRLRRGLRKENSDLAKGVPVVSNSDALKWLLENLQHWDEKLCPGELSRKIALLEDKLKAANSRVETLQKEVDEQDGKENQQAKNESKQTSGRGNKRKAS